MFPPPADLKRKKQLNSINQTLQSTKNNENDKLSKEKTRLEREKKLENEKKIALNEKVF